MRSSSRPSRNPSLACCLLAAGLTLTSTTARAQTPAAPAAPAQQRSDSPDPTDPNDHRPAPPSKTSTSTDAATNNATKSGTKAAATKADAAKADAAKADAAKADAANADAAKADAAKTDAAKSDARTDAATKSDGTADPQQRRPRTPPPPPPRSSGSARTPERAFRVAGFVDFGSTNFTASQSFDAILDKSSTTIIGGGGQLALRSGIFVQVDITHSSDNGERVFVNNGQVFKLGIPTTVEMTPIDLTAGYRFHFGRRRGPALPAHPKPAERFVPYVGGGIGTVRYKETSKFAQSGDDVDDSFFSYNIVGGLEVGIYRWIGAGVELQQRWVPNALGDAGVSKAFNETDLGGSTIRVKVIVAF
jgi:hypothetical protein